MALAAKCAYRLMLVAVLMRLGFSLYFAYIEAHILGVCCIYALLR